MTDIEKLQRKLLRDAEQARPQDHNQYQRRRKSDAPSEPRVERLYCAACLALLVSEQCPRCDHQRSNVIGYCRKCMHVHAHGQPCKAWTPKAPE